MADLGDEKLFYAIMAVVYVFVVVIHGLGIYFDKLRGVSVPGKKFQMLGFVLLGIAFFVQSIEFSHPTIPHKLHVVFALPGCVAMLVGAILSLTQVATLSGSPLVRS